MSRIVDILLKDPSMQANVKWYAILLQIYSQSMRDIAHADVMKTEWFWM